MIKIVGSRYFRCLLAAIFLMAVWPNTISLLVANAQGPGTNWARPWDVTTEAEAIDGVHQYCVLLVDGQQNVHLLWAHNTADSLGGGGAELFYRNDVQGDWSHPIDVIAIPGHVMADLSAAISPVNNTIHVLWHDQYIGGDLYYARAWLNDAGDPRAWAPPTLLGGNMGGALAIDAQGILHVALWDSAEVGQQTSNIYYIRSEDDGDTWSDPVRVYQAVTAVPSSSSAEIAVDLVGHIHLAITVRSLEYGAYSEAGYLRSEDAGASWGPYRQVAFGGTAWQGINRIKVFAFGADEIHLTWHDPRRMHQWSSDGGITWSSPEEIIDLGAAFGGNNQLAVDSAGRLYVVTATGDGVYVSVWDGDRWQLFAQVENRFIDPHGQNLVVSQGNRLHVAYYDRILGKVWYSSCQISAPGISRQPLPTQAPEPTIIPTATPDTLSGGEAAFPTNADLDLRASAAPLDPGAATVWPLVWAIFPALLLMGSVLLFRHK